MINSIQSVRHTIAKLENLFPELGGNAQVIVSEAITELDAVEYNLVSELNRHNNDIQELNNKGQYLDILIRN